jgi:hypothetical protein
MIAKHKVTLVVGRVADLRHSTKKVMMLPLSHRRLLPPTTWPLAVLLTVRTASTTKMYVLTIIITVSIFYQVMMMIDDDGLPWYPQGIVPSFSVPNHRLPTPCPGAQGVTTPPSTGRTNTQYLAILYKYIFVTSTFVL